MSSDDAWSIPDTSATPAASAMSAVPAADPVVPGAVPDAASAAVPAVAAVPRTVADAGVGIAGGLGVIQRQRIAEPNRALWLIVAALFLVAGLTQIVYLLAHSETFLPGQPNYELLAIDAYYGLRAVLMFACGALLLNRRTRELAAGLALSVSALSLAFYFGTLRPSVITGTGDRLAIYMGVGATVIITVAGIVAFVAVVRERREGRVYGRQSRVDRVVAVAAAFFGAMILFAGECTDTYRVALQTTLGDESVQCCGWSKMSSWRAAELLVGAAVTLVLAVFAATLRSKKFAAGLLFGTTVLPLSPVAQVVALSAAPLQSLYGFHYTSSPLIPKWVTGSPVAGFWLQLFGVLLLVSAAVARLLLGRRRNPYSAQPFAAPGHSAPVL
jgi:hypothetical protein